jgi:hypothetical protein
MNLQSIIIVLLAAVVVLYFFWVKMRKPQADTDTTRPSEDLLPLQQKRNDKLVIVNDILETDIHKILSGFCNMYNKEKYQAQPRLVKIRERNFAITFPFDIDFDVFCYFINYIHYPMGFAKSFHATGWTTIDDTWIKEKIENKKAMLYIPSDNKERDNVFMTTSDNIGFKLGFALGEEKQLLDKPKMQFGLPTINRLELVTMKYKDFK